MKIAMLGYGHVAKGFIELLKSRQAALRADYGFAPRIVAIATRRGAMVYRIFVRPWRRANRW